MSKINELRRITNKNIKSKERTEQMSKREFLNSATFKKILSDFEEDALNVAKKGNNIWYISSLIKYLGYGYDTYKYEKFIIYAMEKNGYKHWPESFLGFSW